MRNKLNQIFRLVVLGSLTIFIGCEDDNEESPLVGVWEMNEMSGGLFMRVNKIFINYTRSKY